MQEKLARSGQVAANAPELQRELEQVTAQIRQIDSVLKQISERKRAEAESTAKVARNVDEQLKALDRFAEARENLRQFQA